MARDDEMAALPFRVRLALWTGLLILFLGLWIVSGRWAHRTLEGLTASGVLFVVLLALAWVDWREFRLPLVLTLPLGVAGLVWGGLYGPGWGLSLAGAGIGFGVILGLSVFWDRVLGREGIGLGDGVLLGIAGAWLGAFGLPVVLMIASGAGLLAILVLRGLFGGRSGQQPVAFGPFLSLGLWTVWCVPGLIFGR